MKAIMKILIMFFFSCVVAYLIGQKIVVPLTSGGTNQEMFSVSSDFIACFDDGIVDNFKKTEDNPWNKNIGKIEDDVIGESILMTPNTSVVFSRTLDENNTLLCEYMIHPWMKEVSDGADLTFVITDKDSGDVYVEKKVFVSKEDNHKKLGFSLKDCEGKAVDIKIVAGNGENDNTDGDWIVFTKLEIE